MHARVRASATAKMSIPKGNKMLQYVNYRMRVTLDDARVFIGRFLAFDKHMNIVLADCEELRRTKKDIPEKRAMGLVLLRGECVVSLSIESPPPPPAKKRPALPRGATPAGRGIPLPAAGRGMPPDPSPAQGAVARPPGLAGPFPGVGMPAAAMQPHMAGAPQMYARPGAMHPPAVPGSLPAVAPGGAMHPPPGARHPAMPPPPDYGRGMAMGPGAHLQTAPPGWGQPRTGLAPAQPPPGYGRGAPPSSGPPPPPPS